VAERLHRRLNDAASEESEPMCGHVEVDSEGAISAYAREFEERVLALLAL
jgi:hypothetical protein